LAARAVHLADKRQGVNERLGQLRAAIHIIGGIVPDNQATFHEMRQRFDELVKDADLAGETRGDTLSAKKNAVEMLKTRLTGLQSHIDALAETSSHLPLEDLRRRDKIAQAVGLPSSDLPYIGELVDVDPAHKDWRIALEKLLRVQARRMLVPAEHFGRVAAYVNDTDFGARVRFERVLTRTARFSMNTADNRRAYTRLKIKPNTPFADWLHTALQTRFDHACFTSVLEYEGHQGSALTINGLMKDRGDYHEKRDDFRIKDPRDYFLGWNNDEKVRSLRGEKTELELEMRKLVQAVIDQRSSNDTVKMRRDMAMDVLKNLPTFDLVDIGSVNRDLASLEKEHQHLAKSDPEAAKVAADLSKATENLAEFRTIIQENIEKCGGRKVQLNALDESLVEINSWKTTAMTLTLKIEVVGA
jgi:uncharacterized protein YPO0396